MSTAARTAAGLFLLLAVSGCSAPPQNGAQQFMVAAANPLAAQAGVDILHNGGTAADAAVAVQLVLNLVEPQSSGIGGGAFALYWERASALVQSYDGRETAPAAATENYFLDAAGKPLPWRQAVPGGLSVGVPGTLQLLETLHREHGVLPWRGLFAPALRIARDGFHVSPRLAQSIAGAADNLALFARTREFFLDADGAPLAAGHLLRNPRFADTLEKIAAGGSAAFYHGATARNIVNTVNNAPLNPGMMRAADLAQYRVRKRPAVCFPYRAHKICSMGPPSSGALTVGQILGMLSHFNLGRKPTARAVHLFAEAARLAYADRALYMADSDFVDLPGGLLDPAYLEQRARLIHPQRAMEKAPAGRPPRLSAAHYGKHRGVELPGTSHFSIVDARGNVLSMTTTIESGFGSHLMVDGFLLNNELTDFSFVPRNAGRPVANRVEGGKRPRSSMSPAIVFNAAGEPFIVLGSMGGSHIINHVAKTLIAMLDWNMNPQDAVDLGHFVNTGGAIKLEAGTAIVNFAPALQRAGHEIEIRELRSGLHVIKKVHGKLTGGADRRLEGVALGG